jgi:4'-phosphopantetheinyl transferase superfamily protein
MLPMLGQSSTGAECAAQLWLATPECGIGAACNVTPRKVRRALESTASLALLTNTGAPAMPRRSLSHSNGCAAIAIVPAGCRAGIDIEATTSRDVRSIAQFAFAPDEAEALHSLAEPEATAQFYFLWTLKEAFAKALGMPLLAAMRECTFACRDGCITVRVPSTAPWRATVFAPRPALTLAAVIIGPRQAVCDGWECREWPGTAEGSWRRLATFAGDGHRAFPVNG